MNSALIKRLRKIATLEAEDYGAEPQDHSSWQAADVIERQAAQIEMMRSTLQGIVGADWRKWEELASPEEFVRWAKSQANHVLSTTPDQALEQFLTHIRVITELPKGELK